MKKTILVILAYTAAVFGGCVLVSFLFGHLPVLLPKVAGSYKFLRGLLWFLKVLPSVLFSGFIIGCAVQWKDHDSDSDRRFSVSMGSRYQKVMILGLVVTLVLSLGQEAFVPSIERKLAKHAENPAMLQKYMTAGQSALDSNKTVLAWQYAGLAFDIAPKDPQAAELYAKAKDAMELYMNSSSGPSDRKVSASGKPQGPVQTADSNYTVRQLVEKSEQAALEKRWFDSHYWATLAVQACSGTDTNLAVAQQCANRAWNELNKPERYEDKEQEAFFKEKKAGYTALNEGYNLKAYYIFARLADKSVEYAGDSDVKKYYSIAKERVEDECFFIDETDDVKKNESVRNILFRLPHADGSCDVVFIKGAASVKQTGTMIRYLDGLTIVSYDKDGNFCQTMSVPFAKMYEQPVDVLGEEKMKALGIDPKYRSVPYIFLKSVDRLTEGVVSEPVYSYDPTGIPIDVVSVISSTGHKVPEGSFVKGQLSPVFQQMKLSENTILLPMPYGDFTVVHDASLGPEKMPLFSLVKFAPKSAFYGYSFEVFTQNLVQRCVYPLLILILLVFSATNAWNYKVNGNEMFKFRWLFMIPVLNVVNYLLLAFAMYLFSFINYFFVGVCGAFALVAAVVFYVLLFVVVSVQFLARRN